MKSDIRKGTWKPNKEELEEFSSPAIFKSHRQFRMKKMQKMSEEIYTPEHTFRTKTDLNEKYISKPFHISTNISHISTIIY